MKILSRSEEEESSERLLRDAAEEKLGKFTGTLPEMKVGTPEELLYELKVHQIELEMQNEELRRAQVALEQSRQRYSDLYHFAPVGYFTFTPEALIKEVNLTGSVLIGLARQKLINTRFRRIVTAKDQDLWDQHFLRVLREGEKQTCDLVLNRQDGSTFYVGLESIRVEKSRGSFEIHTTVTDITERKRLEEVLRQSEEKYRTAIIEEITEGYYEVDLAGNFTFVNDSMTLLLQYSREELIGMNYRSFIPKDEVEGVYETFNRVYRTGEIVKGFSVTNIRKDGMPIFMEDSISRLRAGEGRIIGFRGICRDVSRSRRAEDRMQTSIGEKEVLSREVHHRVKNNLQVIQSLLNLETRRIKDPQALEVFNKIREHIRSMSLVHEKLYQSPDLTRIDMADYLRSLSISLFHFSRINQDRVKLKVEVEKVQVSVDKAIPLGLIINELISNGLKHAFPEERIGEIHVGLSMVDEGMIRLTVGDNGIGFPRDVDFRKTDSMGFQVVMALVQQLEGTIGFHREVGTEFRITFPSKYSYAK